MWGPRWVLEVPDSVGVPGWGVWGPRWVVGVLGGMWGCQAGCGGHSHGGSVVCWDAFAVWEPPAGLGSGSCSPLAIRVRSRNLKYWVGTGFWGFCQPCSGAAGVGSDKCCLSPPGRFVAAAGRSLCSPTTAVGSFLFLSVPQRALQQRGRTEEWCQEKETVNKMCECGVVFLERLGRCILQPLKT